MTHDSAPDNRHVPFSVVKTYVTEGLPGGFTIDGVPEAQVQIAPGNCLISLLVRAVDNVAGPDTRGLANLEYSLEDHAGTMWHRLDVGYQDNLPEVYSLLCSIIDRIQLRQQTFSQAVGTALAGLGEILAGRGGLTRDQQVGLFGELITLLSISAHSSPGEAIRAWRGPFGEEHDFGLPTADLEVKTTTSEERDHWIAGLKQLTPSLGRPLHLLSVQITAAGLETGFTLPTLVEVARNFSGMPLEELSVRLESVGYQDTHADLYVNKWRLRTAPAFYLVDEDFPALTSERVSSLVSSAELIKDVRYRINLDTLPRFYPELFPVQNQGMAI